MSSDPEDVWKRHKRSRVVTDRESGLPSTVAGFRTSRKYILDSQLTPYDFIPPDVKPCGLFHGSELVYRRSQITALRSSASWKSKFSKAVKPTERPVRVIQRDVGGVSRTVELYSEDQTEPLPNLVASVESGIPTNEFGNVEIDRIPANAALIPVEADNMALAMRACKSLGSIPWCKCQIGWKRKMPVFGGIVVLDQDRDRVDSAIAAALETHTEKEQLATEQATLSLWRQLLRRISAEWYMRSVIDPS